MTVETRPPAGSVEKANLIVMGNTGRRAAATLLCAVLSAAPLRSEPMVCPDSVVSVTSGSSQLAETVCEAAAFAEEMFGQCNVPSLDRPVAIHVVDDLMDGCVALYHCGNDKIEVLTPGKVDERRDPDGAFSFLPSKDYFRSIIVHELSHAAFDSVPCPFSSCAAANEYVAYSMQVMSLSEEEQRTFAARADLDRKVSRDELSKMILYFAPHRFAQRAWTHLQQRDDPCAFIGQITDGTVLLDHEHF